MADKQTASSKLEQKNAAMDKAQEEGRKRYEKQEIEDNQAPRKAVGEAIDYVKEKASKFGKDFVEGAKQYGEAYKKGLGMKGGGMANTSRMNRLEELGRVDSEKAFTPKGKKNLADEKKRIVGEMKYAKGGSASSRADGIATKGKTRGKIC